VLDRGTLGEVLQKNHAALEQRDIPPEEALAFFVLSLVATMTIAFCYGIIDLPLLEDNQHYFYMSERVASGVSPYKSHFDPKQALSMLLTGAAIFAGRVIGIADLTSARFLSLVVLGISNWLAWRLTRHLTKSPQASLLAFLSMFTFPGFVYMGVMGSRPKSFLVLFMLLTTLFFVQGRLFWSGVSASLAFLCWQPGLLMMGPLVFVLILYPKRWQRIGRALVGATLPLLIYQSYFVITGSLEEQLIQTYFFPAKFMSHNFAGFIESFYRLALFWHSGLGLFNFLPLICIFGMGSRLVCFIVRKETAQSFISAASPGWLYVGLCALGCSAFTYYDHQGYPDLFFLLPFVAVISPCVIELHIGKLSHNRTLAYGLVIVYLIALIVTGIMLKPAADYTLNDQLALASKVKQMLDDNETVYAIGCTHLLAFNHSENWMKYGFFFRGVEEFVAEETGIDTFMPVKEGAMPSIVLLSRRPPRGSESWLDSLYTEQEIPAFNRQGIRVFKQQGIHE
jgi:hypothetical protein